MDDLEKAIHLCYEPSVADPAICAQAMAFCDRLKADPSALIHLRLDCLDGLQRSPVVPVQFWCLQALHDVILLRYASIPPADLSLLRPALLFLASDRPLAPAASPHFLRNKLAQALAALIRLEYPAPSLPDPFLRVLPSLPAADPAAIDMFARFLAALDEDLRSLDYLRSPEEAAAASQLKDTMRQQCVPQIARHWFDVVSLYHSSDPSLAALSLDTMRRYITWIDIGLVANDAFVPLLFGLILAPGSTDQLRAAASSCILAIILKRMDHRQIGIDFVLDNSFNFHDANTLILFGEIVLAQKVMYEKLGRDFAIHFVSSGLQGVHCPHELAEQYYEKLQTNDVKELKSSYHQLIENLRQQQNGSLVFRLNIFMVCSGVNNGD